MYYCFLIQPWSKNVTRSLLKEPKIYLWDWSLIENSGARAENFIAAHLLKACHYWTDRGMGVYDFFLRDKEKRAVDFLVTKNEIPWFLVEVKSSKGYLSPSLGYFQKQIQAIHAFQVLLDAEFEKIIVLNILNRWLFQRRHFFLNWFECQEYKRGMAGIQCILLSHLNDISIIFNQATNSCCVKKKSAINNQ
ncbi:MAG: DUF4143 domain-containing protein [Parachlamydiaceae bacterium]|nr:DUF4143 domain-containing protein [Parachlamydiaceae bacterium]